MPHCVVNIVNEDMSFQSGHATQALQASPGSEVMIDVLGLHKFKIKTVD